MEQKNCLTVEDVMVRLNWKRTSVYKLMNRKMGIVKTYHKKTA